MNLNFNPALRARNAAYLVILMGLSFSACSQKDREHYVDDGALDGEMYRSETLGWSIRIPDGWKVMSRDTLATRTKDGMGRVSEAIGTDVDYSGVKFLISFQKDASNSFQSTAESFEEDDIAWQENNRIVKEVLFDTYFHRGIPADTSSATVVIDGLTFDLFRVKVSNSLGQVVLHQDIYSRLINEHSFAAILNYNNDDSRDAMQEVFLNSQFNTD